MRRLAGRLSDETGATAVIMAMTMTIVLIIAALVVDVGAGMARNAQLQDAADAAAIALAQRCYESDATNELDGCDETVQAAAAAVATDIATATVSDGEAALVGSPVFTADTVTVNLASPQASLFGWSAGSEGTDVGASATAEWNQGVVALPLAINSCTLPEPSDNTVFIGTGVYSGVQSLVTSVTALPLLSGSDVALDGYVENILDCGTNVLAGGWLATPDNECSFEPNLGTYTGATVNKVLPIESCVDTITTLVGKRIIVPVYDESTVMALNSLGGTVNITRFAEIVVTGYDFDGLLGIGDLRNPESGLDPGCSRTLEEFLGLELGLVGDAIQLLQPVLDLLPVILACQGIQGQVVNDNLTAEEASALLVPYRLVA